MPIRQLRNKTEDNEDTGFITRSFGSRTSTSRKPSQAEMRSRAAGRGSWSRELPRRQKNESSSARGRSLLKFMFISILVVGILGFVAFAWLSKDLPDPNKIIQRDVAQSTKIYDRTGKILLYEIHGAERRTLIELSDIPKYAIDATVAIEDKNFYKHKGLSLPNIIKAVGLDLLSRVGLYKGLVPGGSTLTQQFIKNAVLTNEKSYTRKIKEWVLAYRLEKKFTKDQILKMYFNEIPYGSTAYGIETAAHVYFDKSAKDLTLAEATILAAMPQAPTYYSPYGSHKDELINRQRFILKLMVEQKYITQEEADRAKAEPIVFKKKKEDMLAPHFVLMVKEQLSERYGERLVEQGGLKIITTLDMDKQKAAEAAVAEFAPSNAEKYNAQNASLVSIDAATGQIVALVGSKDYFDDSIDGQVNVAISPRQPGSSLKPLIYAEAFNQGYRPDTMLFDLVTPFAASGTQYKPQDYDGKERGPISLRAALQGSLNIPAVKTLYLIGVNRAVELAKEIGYTTLVDPDRYGLSLVLGGGEVKLVEHANAYAAFAREGLYKPYASVLRVEDRDGAVLEEYRDDPGKRVLPRTVVRTLTNVLSDNASRAYIFGAANHLTLPDRPVAAKTGTTNNYKDAWTLGFTPSLVTGVWVGNSSGAEMKRGADGSVIAAPIWQRYMSTVLAGTPVEAFKDPDPLLPCDRPMLCGAVGDERIVKINIDNGKLASEYTPPSKIKELVFKDVHEILHYVRKEDPLGDAPTNPSDDPQYSLWEGPVQEWAKKQGFASSTIPTEVDTSYQAEDQPTISWTTPRDGEVITSPSATLAVQTYARRGVVKVEYYLDSQLISTVRQLPFSSVLQITPIIQNGPHTLTAVASDDIGDEKRASLSITIQTTRDPNDWQVSWTSPQPYEIFTASTTPREITVDVTNPQRISKIDYYLRDGAAVSYIGTQLNPTGIVTQPWTPPVKIGTYRLFMIITDKSGLSFTYPDLSFELRSY